MSELLKSPLPFRGGAGGGDCPQVGVLTLSARLLTDPTPTPPLKGRGL